jgi:N4-bis(aminopropyl)spermidine synthase
MEEIINYILEKATKIRPRPKREYDQFFATKATIVKRVKILSKFNKKRLLFLGDSDLTSISLAYYFKKINRQADIVVLDIDKDLVDLIEKIKAEENLNIKTIHRDIRDVIDKDLVNFDLAFFDPPYTPNGIRIWLIRALQVLLGRGSNKKRKKVEFLKKKFILMCYGYTDNSLEKGYKIQKIINDLGLVIQAKYRKFNKYTGAESINNESDLYILQPAPQIDLSKIDHWRNKKFEIKIYTYEIGTDL